MPNGTLNVAFPSAQEVIVNSGNIAVSGTVNIGNTPNVGISGTPTVNIGNSPSVSISGTPNVAVSSGTITVGTINGGTINNITEPITARSKVAAGYQESVMYLNNANGTLFMSGSSSDSSGNYFISNFNRANILSDSVESTNFEPTLFRQFTTLAHVSILSSIALGVGGTTAMRAAIYTDSAGSPSTLVADLGVVFNGSYVANSLIYLPSPPLTANTTYWLALTALSGNILSQYGTTGTGKVGYNGSSYYSSGFPSTAPALTFVTGGISGLALNYGDNITMHLQFSLGQASTTQYNGQQVFKFGLYAQNTNTYFALHGITLTTEGNTAGHIRVSTPADAYGLGGQVNTDGFLSDAGATLNTTLNAGDTLLVVIDCQVLADTDSLYLDCINGVSYVVFPLQ